MLRYNNWFTPPQTLSIPPDLYPFLQLIDDDMMLPIGFWSRFSATPPRLPPLSISETSPPDLFQFPVEQELEYLSRHGFVSFETPQKSLLLAVLNLLYHLESTVTVCPSVKYANRVIATARGSGLPIGTITSSHNHKVITIKQLLAQTTPLAPDAFVFINDVGFVSHFMLYHAGVSESVAETSYRILVNSPFAYSIIDNAFYYEAVGGPLCTFSQTFVQPTPRRTIEFVSVPETAGLRTQGGRYFEQYAREIINNSVRNQIIAQNAIRHTGRVAIYAMYTSHRNEIAKYLQKLNPSKEIDLQLTPQTITRFNAGNSYLIFPLVRKLISKIRPQVLIFAGGKSGGDLPLLLHLLPSAGLKIVDFLDHDPYSGDHTHWRKMYYDELGVCEI